MSWRTDLKASASLTPFEPPPPPSLAMKIMMWASWLALAVAAVLLLRAAARAAGGAGSWGAVVVLALVVVGLIGGKRIATQAATVDADRAAEIVSALLDNVYRAFDSRDETTILVALDRSVAADLSGAVLKAGRGLGLSGRESGPAKVQRIELAGLAMAESEDGFEARCAWTVTVEIGHWGHLHRSVHRIVADLSIAPVDGVWKITGMEFIETQRL